MLAWGSKVSPEFRRKTVAIAAKGGFPASWLMSVMAFETGETFSASVRNPLSGATGLIQFMPSTAVGMGTTVDALAKKTPEEQLDDVEKYFDQYLGRIKTFSDCYMAVLWPAAIGKPESFPLITDTSSKAYIQNRNLDLNRDGNITKEEAASFVAVKLQKGMQSNLATIDDRTRPEDEMSEAPQQPSLLETIGGIASMINPTARIIFSAFSPLIQQKISAEVDRHSSQPGVGQAVADALSTALTNQAIAVTGRTDALEAAAVVVQPQNADKLQDVAVIAQEAVKKRLDQLAPLLDKSVDYDKAKWQAEREGRIAASNAAIAEKQAGLWDMTPTLVGTACALLAIISAGLLAAVLAQALTGDRKIDGALIGLSGPIWMGTIAAWTAMIAFRFDGSKQSSDQTKALIDAAKNGGVKS